MHIHSVDKHVLQSQEIKAVARRYEVVSMLFELLEIGSSWLWLLFLLSCACNTFQLRAVSKDARTD